MDDLLRSITHGGSVVLLCSTLLSVLSFLLSVTLLARFKKQETKWKQLLTSARGESLDEMLYQHLSERGRINERLAGVDGRLDKLEDKMKGAKRFMGLVRYDAFPDVAGNQSFAMAVYDEIGDGAILSSIVGRNSCRVYCKPLVSGRSERDLSQEEQRAVREAKESGLRTILSP